MNHKFAFKAPRKYLAEPCEIFCFLLIFRLVLTPQFSLRYFKENGQLVEQKVHRYKLYKYKVEYIYIYIYILLGSILIDLINILFP